MWFPRSLLSSLVVLQVLLGLGSAQLTVLGPGHPLRAAVGQDVVLPCHLSPSMDIRSLEIRWIRYQISETVHHYGSGEDLHGEQMKEYAGRTELPRDGLPSGRLDLRIIGLRPSDDGQYVCTVQGPSSYGEATVDLEVTATGSVLHLSLEAYEDGGVRVLCRSAGWYPQPEVLWRDAGGQRVPSVSQRSSADERGLFEFEDVIVVTGKGPGNWSCVVRNSRLSQEQESSLHISAPFFHDARPWMAALGVFFVLWVVFVVLSAYLFWRKVLQSRELAWRKFLLPQNPDVVTLDRNTAHARLVISEDLRSIRLESSRQDVPDTPERFNTRCCVLGREMFSAGRHCWEVEGKLKGNSWWAVGVARNSVERLGDIDLSPKGGIWGLRQWNGKFTAMTSPHTALTLSPVPRRVCICVDCTEGLVTFINANSGAEIFTFPPASFNGEIRPWFWVGTEETQLYLSGSSPQTTILPPLVPTKDPENPCPPPDPARSPLLPPAGADVPPCPAQAPGPEQD
ncbi:butyrophilin subfamily 1 member A1 isoform X2 [Opisthocomus hoazin]|uniref:butyrophilin subfamily 1 member A1 isoform X2 n=1 Tax=Opisthocomus hoazin TaxID=30419 RepID=UPI003F53D3E1